MVYVLTTATFRATARRPACLPPPSKTRRLPERADSVRAGPAGGVASAEREAGADVRQRGTGRGGAVPLLNDVIGASQHGWRDGQSQRLCRSQVHDQLELRRLLDRK